MQADGLDGGQKKGAQSVQHPDVARQFEAILVRQMVSESMKPLLEHGKEGQIYGYFLADALAEGITKAGGLGIRSIIQGQLNSNGAAGSVPPHGETLGTRS